MINFVRIVTFIVAIVITVFSMFYIDSEQELALAHQAYRAGDMDQSLRLARRANWVSSNNDEKIEAYNLQAKAAAKMNWTEKAELYLDQLLSLDSENIQALLFRGEIKYQLSKNNDALLDFNKGLNIAADKISKNTLAYYFTQRGLTHLSLNHTAEAEKDALIALDLKANLSEAHDLMSKVFEENGNIKKSLKECELAYQLASKKDKLFFLTPKGRKLSDRLINLKVKNIK